MIILNYITCYLFVCCVHDICSTCFLLLIKDVQDLAELKIAEVKESKAAKRLFKVVNKLIGKLDKHVTNLEQKEEAIKKDLESLEKKKLSESDIKESDFKESEVVRYLFICYFSP